MSYKNFSFFFMLLIAENMHAAGTINAYYPQWGIYNGTNFFPKTMVSNATAALLNNLTYAFAGVQNGRCVSLDLCVSLDPWADYQYPYTAQESINGQADTNAPGAVQGNFHQLQLLNQSYPNLKVVISIGGARQNLAELQNAAQPPKRSSFVGSCINMFVKGNLTAGLSALSLFDGVDIDWEFPSSTDTQNFTGLIAEFRNQLNALQPGLLLTIASGASASQYRNIAMGTAAQYLDWFNVMSYAYEGPWNPVTGFPALLYHVNGDSYFENIDATISGYRAVGGPLVPKR